MPDIAVLDIVVLGIAAPDIVVLDTVDLDTHTVAAGNSVVGMAVEEIVVVGMAVGEIVVAGKVVVGNFVEGKVVVDMVDSHNDYHGLDGENGGCGVDVGMDFDMDFGMDYNCSCCRKLEFGCHLILLMDRSNIYYNHLELCKLIAAHLVVEIFVAKIHQRHSIDLHLEQRRSVHWCFVKQCLHQH